jgi:hypothetical protein
MIAALQRLRFSLSILFRRLRAGIFRHRIHQSLPKRFSNDD